MSKSKGVRCETNPQESVGAIVAETIKLVGLGIRVKNLRMLNRMYGGVRGRKMK